MKTWERLYIGELSPNIPSSVECQLVPMNINHIESQKFTYLGIFNVLRVPMLKKDPNPVVRKPKIPAGGSIKPIKQVLLVPGN